VTRATLVRLIAVTLVLTAITAVPMVQIPWDGTQASAEADDIDTLLNVMIILSCFVFSIVMVMLGYSIWKYRAKPGDESDGEPIHGNAKLEVTWTVIPTVIVLFGAIYSWIVLGDIETKAANRLRLDVTAQQFAWTFNYPQENGKVVSSKALVVPENRQLELHLTALDVIHSFWVPEWRIKRDLVPAGEGGNDIDNVVEVTPNRLGTYNVVCTELCGYGHATMRALVRVVPEEEFNQWLSRQKPVEPQQGTATGTSTGASAADESGAGSGSAATAPGSPGAEATSGGS
jgi:cytochrome c oxidase subunit 2